MSTAQDLVATPGSYTSLSVGPCTNYTTLATGVVCQSVTFVSGACLGLDGTACRYLDQYALTSIASTGLALTW